MPAIPRWRRRQQAQEFALKLVGFAFCEPESLLEFCNVVGCETRFVANERQRRLLALGKSLCCDEHRHSQPDQPRPGRTVHQLVPREDKCDRCGKPFVAVPRKLVLTEMRHWRLLCGRCDAVWQREAISICPCCGLSADCAAFRDCSISGCIRQSVEIWRRTLPKLLAAPLDPALWRQIIEASAASEDPEHYRRVSVATRVGCGRRGKTQKWLNGERVFWR
jgi:hypothetical protein